MLPVNSVGQSLMTKILRYNSGIMLSELVKVMPAFPSSQVVSIQVSWKRLICRIIATRIRPAQRAYWNLDYESGTAFLNCFCLLKRDFLSGNKNIEKNRNTCQNEKQTHNNIPLSPNKEFRKCGFTIYYWGRMWGIR